ncbi:GlxA family transcriptional regulator [Desulfospira joergensenii]|uniref:GlxA family transcriptional regulator n=1 Tax=Desulfospira joergensenii TaxID=53329 RepID=UPI0003B37A08|nr:GlxA family transcriptional regulator [Desulfospira joergensenii]
MTHKIEFIVFPDALGLDITGPLEVFHTASQVLERRGKKNSGYQTRFTGIQKGPVALSSGLEVVADSDLNDPISSDTLLIPGGSDREGPINDSGFMAYIRARADRAKRIVSVCEGAFILAAAGILDGKKTTTHWASAEDLARAYPDVKVDSEAIFTREGRIYTSAGATAGIDLALALVEEDFGMDLALEVARLLVLYFRRPGSQAQFSQPLKAQEAAGARFAKLHNWLISNLDQPVSVEDMAGYAAMSQRNFARVFKSSTGMTPGRYLERLRLDRAREIIGTCPDSLETIAVDSGFGREERLRRAFVRRFGITPSQYRLHFME